MSPKRSRRTAGTAPPATGGEPDATRTDPSVAALASFLQAEADENRDARKAAKAQRAAAEQRDRLERGKDAAAAELKRLRATSGVTAEQRAAAEDRYRRALAAVIEADTGQVPHWSPISEADGSAGEDRVASVGEPAEGEIPSEHEPADEDRT